MSIPKSSFLLFSGSCFVGAVVEIPRRSSIRSDSEVSVFLVVLTDAGSGSSPRPIRSSKV